MNPNHETAQRKRQLLAEGAVYRASLAASMHEVRQSLHGESLARRASGFVLATALGMVKRKGGISGIGSSIGSSIGLQGWLPFAIEAFSLMSKKPFLKKILRVAAVAAGAAGAANIFMRRRQATAEGQQAGQGIEETG